VCTNCGVCMGRYFCDICKLFDDDVRTLQLYFSSSKSNIDLFELYKKSSYTFCFIFFQISKQQYHCNGCGICRYNINSAILSLLSNLLQGFAG
jgi:RING finger and CHY zinc finger domain-containing protein 1